MGVFIGGYVPGLQFRLNAAETDSYIIDGGGEDVSVETDGDRQREVTETMPATYGTQYEIHAVVERGVAYGHEPIVTYSSSDEGIAIVENDTYLHLKCNDNDATTTVIDSSGNGRNGTASTNTNNLSTASGVINRAFEFNGTSEIISTGIKVPIGAKSFAFWARPTESEHSNPIDSIYSETNISSNSYGNHLYWYKDDNLFRWYLYHSVSVNYIFELNSSVLSPNTLYHVVFTWDGTTNANGVKIYINGEIDQQTTASTEETVAPSNNGKIGDDYYSEDRYYEGLIDDFRIYTRELTSGEVLALYNEGNGTESVIEVVGRTIYQSEGDFYIEGTSEETPYYPSRSRRVYLTNTESSEESVIVYGPWVPVVGSVREEAEAAVDDRISVSVDKYIYSTQDHTTPTYVRNGDCWAADLDLTCISPWNSTNANKRAGTLISPRHIIFATHYQIGTGATVRFVDPSNNVVERTMTAKQNMPGYVPYWPDLTVGLLNSDVPVDITFCKVMPDDWVDYLPTQSSGIPALCLDQEEKALVTDISNIDGSYCSFKVPTDETRLQLYESKISGDSGNPAFMIVNNELILLTVWTYGGAGSGTSVHNQKSNINSVMTSLGGGYQLTEADLSGFTDFGS